jgi:hypothetical protein
MLPVGRHKCKFMDAWVVRSFRSRVRSGVLNAKANPCTYQCTDGGGRGSEYQHANERKHDHRGLQRHKQMDRNDLSQIDSNYAPIEAARTGEGTEQAGRENTPIVVKRVDIPSFLWSHRCPDRESRDESRCNLRGDNRWWVPRAFCRDNWLSRKFRRFVGVLFHAAILRARSRQASGRRYPSSGGLPIARRYSASRA